MNSQPNRLLQRLPIQTTSFPIFPPYLLLIHSTWLIATVFLDFLIHIYLKHSAIDSTQADLFCICHNQPTITYKVQKIFIQFDLILFFPFQQFQSILLRCPSYFFNYIVNGRSFSINNNLNRQTKPYSMKVDKRQNKNGPSKMAVRKQNHFYFLVSELRFFQFESMALTIILFFAWNLPLLRILQTFVGNNPKVTDPYLTSIYAISKFLFSIEQFVTVDFIDRNYQNCNVLNLIFFMLLLIYGIYILFLYQKAKNSSKIGKNHLIVFRIFTFSIYFLCFYIYIVSWTALIKDIRGDTYRYLAFSIFNILATFIIVFLIEFYFNQNQYLSQKSLSRLNCQTNTTVFLAKLILGGAIAFKDFFATRNNFVCLFIVASNIILAFQFKNILANISYINQRTQTIYEFFTFGAFVTYFSIIVFYLTNDYAIINNTIFILITVAGLGLRCLSLYKQKRKESLFQDEVMDNHEESELIWRMIQYIKLLRNKFNEKFSLSSLSIIKHLKQCKEPKCFCQQYSDRNGTELVNDREFMLKFITNKLREVKQLHSKSFYLKMIDINFKLTFLQTFTEIYHQYEAINIRNIGMNDSLKGYVIYQFKNEFQKRVEEQNNQSSRLKLQELFQQQIFRSDLIKEMQEVNTKNVKKYSLLSQDFCSLNTVYEVGNDITSVIKRIQTKWFIFKQIDTYNLRILEIFLIYFEYILPIRIQTSELKAIINKRLHSFKFLKGTDEATINKAIYTHKAAVLQTVFHKYDNIRILNISPNCAGLINLDDREIIGKEIHQIMPAYLTTAHKQLITEKLSNVNSLKHLENIRESYFVDHTGHGFSAKVHVKISSIGHEIMFYLLILREDDNNFVILDNDLTIQGFGNRIEKEQIFYKENTQKSIETYCKEDIKALLETKNNVKKTIQISQLTKKIDTKSLIKCNNMEQVDEEEIKNLFDTINYECEVQIQRHYIKNTPYYTLKFGEIKKALKVADVKKVQQSIKKVNKKIGTVIASAQHQNIKKIDSMQMMTEVQIQNKSDVFGKAAGAIEGDNMLGMNQTSSTASSVKESSSLSYTELMMKLKNYLINQQQTPQFSVPFMKAFMILWGIMIIACGFVETYITKTAVLSLSQTYEASNIVNNINQIMQISLNNEKAMQIYCSPAVNYVTRCAYLNSTQNFLNKQLYGLMLDSFSAFLSKKTDMFGIRYYQQLTQIISVQYNDGFITVSHKEFLELFYYSLLQVQSLDFRGQTAQQFKFLNDNWQLLRELNTKSIVFYSQSAKTQEDSINSIIYAYNVLIVIVIIGFALPFHLFLTRCDNKTETIVRLHELIDIQLCKRLMDNEKAIAPLINDGYAEKSLLISDGPSKMMTKRYSQFTYSRGHHQKISVLIGSLIIISLNIAIILSILQFMPIRSKMSKQLQMLVAAQNDAVEDYLSLKMDEINKSFIDQTKAGSSVQYVEELKQVFSIFSVQDKALEGNLKSLTISDLCVLNTGYLWASQISQCQNSRNYQTMKKGLAAATESLVRQTQSTAVDFYTNSSVRSSVLASKLFRVLDDQLFFNMRAYQLVKTELISSLGRTINTFASTLLVFNYLQLVVVGIAIYLSIIFLSRKRCDLRNLFGIVLQIPQKIFAQSKLVMRIVTDTLLQQ